MKIFIDCDVLIDVGLDREPFCFASGELLDYLANHQNTGFIAWHSIANFFYITAKSDLKEQRKSFIAELSSFLKIVAVSNQDLEIALNLEMNDFEGCHAMCVCNGVWC